MPESLHLRISPSVNDNSVRSEFIRHEVLLHIAPFERQRGGFNVPNILGN